MSLFLIYKITDISLYTSSLILILFYPWIKNHTIPLMAVSDPLSAVNLISFSGLISVGRVKPLRVLLRSLAHWKIALRRLSLSTHWVSHYGGAGAGEG